MLVGGNLKRRIQLESCQSERKLISVSSNFCAANLSYLKISTHANLDYADLSYADLRHSNFVGVSLSKVDLSCANLSETNFQKVDFRYFVVLANLSHSITWCQSESC